LPVELAYQRIKLKLKTDDKDILKCFGLIKNMRKKFAGNVFYIYFVFPFGELTLTVVVYKHMISGRITKHNVLNIRIIFWG